MDERYTLLAGESERRETRGEYDVVEWQQRDGAGRACVAAKGARRPLCRAIHGLYQRVTSRIPSLVRQGF